MGADLGFASNRQHFLSVSCQFELQPLQIKFPRVSVTGVFRDHLEMRSIDCDRLFHIATCPSHYGIPKGLRQRRDPARARDHLDQATALFRDMDMTWWLEQAGALGESLSAN